VRLSYAEAKVNLSSYIFSRNYQSISINSRKYFLSKRDAQKSLHNQKNKKNRRLSVDLK
jgi:hypothetical protein